MKQTQNPLIRITQLEYQKGHFQEASISARKAAKESLENKNFTDWLEASRLLLQSGFELDSMFEFESQLECLHQFEKDSEGSLLAVVKYLLAHYSMIKGETAETAVKLHDAIETAAATQNHEYFARSLALAAFFYSWEPQRNISKAIEYLDKLDILIAELGLFDLSVNSLVYRSFLAMDRGHLDRAHDLSWQAYEKAQHHGHQFALPTVLVQISRVHLAQKRQDLFQLYAELALKGVSAQRHPRLYRQISDFCAQHLVKTQSNFDFILDEEQNVLKEREKGYIDFRNQHILLELAVLFLKNPGTRYSKEDLIEKIWKQAYDPDIHDNLIYVSIKRLRLMMEPNSESPKYILRDRQGYYLNAQTQIQLKTREEKV